MDKKILKAMYANIVANDGLRPVLNGVFFEKERCVGTDGHLLVIYKCGIEKLNGKILNQDGEIIDERYPNVDSVIPTERELYSHRIDLKELYAACVYHSRKPDSTSDDSVSILHKTFKIRSFVKLLSVYLAAGQIDKAIMYKSEPDKATIIESKTITSLVMPVVHNEGAIDQKIEEGDPIVMSYENLINDYAFNSWRKQEPKDSLSWI